MNISRRGLTLLTLSALASACASGTRGGTLEEVQALEYRLGPADELRITVFGENELSGQFVVSSRGEIAFPLVGDVKAEGLTITEFAESLTTALGRFLRQPSVSIQVLNYRPFFILGEVRNPGTYPYSASLTVINAVAVAGGFSSRANEGRVYIKHAGETEEHAYRLTTTTPVQPGDTIRIGERRF